MKSKQLLGLIGSIMCVTVCIPVAVSAQGMQRIRPSLTCTDISQNVSYGVIDTASINNVTMLQNFLFALGYYPRAGVGEFGPLTLTAVKNFQKDHSLPRTGFVGPLTRNIIRTISCAEPVPEVVPPAATSIPTQGQVLGVSTTSPQSATSTDAQKNVFLPFNSVLDSHWVKSWGSVSTTTDGTLFLRATASSTGAGALLSGSEQWSDYRYTVNANVSNGSITLIARYTDSKNFLTCSFDGRFVSLGQMLEGKRTTVGSATVKDLPSSRAVVENVTVSMSVVGDTASCFSLGNDPDITYKIPNNQLYMGGIGIETWDNAQNNARLELRTVDVKSLTK